MSGQLIFHSVTYQNFLATGNVPVTVLLDQSPTTLVYGKNGAGKSTIYEALYFGCYGKAFREKTPIPNLINNINNKKMLVMVELSVAGVEYKVIRGRNPTVLEIYRAGKLIDQGSSSRDYQAYFEKVILGMSAETFKQVVILGSLYYVPYMRLTKTKDRMSIVEELLDIQIFSSMWTTARTYMNSLKRSLTELQARENLLKNSVSLTKGYIAEMHAKTENDKEELKKELDRLVADAAVAKTELLHLEAEKLGIDVPNQNALDADKAQWTKYKTLAEKELADLDKHICFLTTTDQCPTCKQTIPETMKEEGLKKSGDRKGVIDNALKLKIEPAFNAAVGALQNMRSLQNAMITLNNKVIAQQQKAQHLQAQISRQTATIAQPTKPFDAPLLQARQMELDGYIADLAALQIESKTMQKDADEYDLIAQLLNDDGIKKNIIRIYIPIINKLMEKYLSILEFPISFAFDEDLNETIIGPGRRQISYELFSAGEKMRVDLALLFAFREIPVIRSGNSCNLLIFDEVAESAMDDDGWDAFFTIINSMADVGNVFVLSPRGEAIAEKFEKTLVFRKEGNFSVCDGMSHA